MLLKFGLLGYGISLTLFALTDIFVIGAVFLLLSSVAYLVVVSAVLTTVQLGAPDALRGPSIGDLFNVVHRRLSAWRRCYRGGWQTKLVRRQPWH